MNVGVEWIVDAAGCDAAALRDGGRVRAVMDRVIRDLELSVIGEGLVHTFGGAGGVTALYLLTESHLACHTYPESGVATVNLYCCRRRPEWRWKDGLTEALGAARVTVREVLRGITENTEDSPSRRGDP
jgi:S-adenosylmethionine decarboxylase